MPSLFAFSGSFRLFASLILLALPWTAKAQTQDDDTSKPLPSVQVNASACASPARVRYSSMSWTQEEDYVPPPRSAAIVSHSVKVDVPMRRGGYFILPEVVDAYRDEGSIQFQQEVTPSLYLVFSLRIGEDQRIGYADLGKAVHQIDTAQARISRFNPVLKAAKHDRHDAITACFLEPGGAILIGGQPAPTLTRGNCKVLAIDPGRFESGDMIEFAGRLDIVTFRDRSDYRL